VTCRELTEFLMRHLDGDLVAAERARFDAHLAACRDCRVYLRNYEEAVRLGKRACVAEHDAVGDDVPEELVQAVLAARRRSS
jgi:anti-sigma factor RsiW